MKVNDIETRLAARGFELIGKFNGHNTPSLLKCANGHIINKRIGAVLYSTSGCLKCYQSGKIVGENGAQKFIESKGWTCPDIDKYQTEDTILTYVCPRAHTMKKRFGLFKSHHKCHQCLARGNIWVDNVRALYPHLTITSKMDNRISATCINCGRAGTYTLRDLSLSQKGGLSKFYPSTGVCCPVDQNITILDLWSYKQLVAATGNATGNAAERLKFTVQCSEGHVFQTTLRYLYEGHGCSLCANQKLSDPEIAIGEFFKSRGFLVEFRNRDIMPGGREIDVLVPEINLGIEYHGIMWHSQEVASKRGKFRDRFKYKSQDKKLLCQKAGINLIFVFENEYVHDPETVWRNLEILAERQEVWGNDLKWVKIKPDISEPIARYYDRYYHEVSKDMKRFTVWDCGVNL
jgi:hypothetical protein